MANDQASPKDDNAQAMKDSEMMKKLQEQLTEQIETNKKLSEKIDVLYRSVDHNAIRKNTPKEVKLPTFRVNMFDGKLIMRWDNMLQNKVIPGPHGNIVQQTTKIYYADDKVGTELPYDDFQSYRTQLEVEATSVVNNDEGTFFEFEYEGETYLINITYIN